MGKTPLIKSQIFPESTNSKSADTVLFQPQKKIVKSKIKSNRIFTISHFLHLIVITSVIFCAGGFGFGLALRYGQIWQNTNNVFATDNSPTTAQNNQ